MEYFDLIFNECKKLNDIMESTFVEKELFFISANISEIVYGLDNNAIVFCYYPERYEYGKNMFLKGIKIRVNFQKEREYSINELYSFIKNDFKFYETLSSFKSIEEQLPTISYLLEYIIIYKTNWEEKFISLKKKTTYDW